MAFPFEIVTKLFEALGEAETTPFSEVTSQIDKLLEIEEPGECRACLDTLSPSPLERMAKEAPWGFGGTAKSVGQEIRELLKTLPDDLVTGRKKLLLAKHRLEGLSFQVRDWKRLLSRVRQGALFTGTGASMCAAAYIHTDLGLGLQHADMNWPPAAYETHEDDGVREFVPREGYLDDYMREFSRSYFGHPGNRYADLHGQPFETKAIFRNLSHGKGRTLSTIEAVVMVKAPSHPFPWERVTVDAQLELHETSLRSTGVGPALNVDWRYGLPKLTLGEGKQAMLHHIDEPIQLLGGVRTMMADQDLRLLGNTVEPGVVRGSAHTGKLEHALYLRLDGAPSSPEEDIFEVVPTELYCMGQAPGWYREIDSVEALANLTPTLYHEPVEVEATWTDLRGTVGKLHIPVELPDGEVYWKSRVELFESDPRCLHEIPLLEFDRDGLVDSLDMMPMMEALAGSDVAPPPAGVDFHTAHLEIPLGGLELGGRAAAVESPDVLLNPQGILFVYLRMYGAGRYRYEYTLGVEGVELARFAVEPLQPEFGTFEEEGREHAVDRLSRLLHPK